MLQSIWQSLKGPRSSRYAGGTPFSFRNGGAFYACHKGNPSHIRQDFGPLARHSLPTEQSSPSAVLDAVHGTVQRMQHRAGPCSEELTIWNSTKRNNGGGQWGTGKGGRGEKCKSVSKRVLIRPLHIGKYSSELCQMARFL